MSDNVEPSDRGKLSWGEVLLWSAEHDPSGTMIRLEALRWNYDHAVEVYVENGRLIFERAPTVVNLTLPPHKVVKVYPEEPKKKSWWTRFKCRWRFW